MKFNSILFLCFLIPTILLAQQRDAAGPTSGDGSVLVPSTKVFMTPPQYFETSELFAGFIHIPSASTIQVTEVDSVPYLYMSKGFTKEEIEKQGGKFISREDVKTQRGDNAVLITLGFVVNEAEFERFMLITGDYNHSVIVNANYPVLGREMMAEVLKKSILSVEF